MPQAHAGWSCGLFALAPVAREQQRDAHHPTGLENILAPFHSFFHFKRAQFQLLHEE